METISHCVWLYYRFPLSLRDIEEMMAQRGVIVSYETIHQWCRKFYQSYANGLRRRWARSGDKWHLDEVFCECVVRWFRSGPLPGSAPVIRDGSEVFWPLRVAVRIRDTVAELATNKTQLAEIVNNLAPGLLAKRGVGPVSGARAITLVVALRALPQQGRVRRPGRRQPA